ncbi:hypothetical protein ASPTUDRAFT_833236 [Aspergillus tubingensis CBS 134.48]|uniref:Uncharacterized protein n=1 Tax=Aspergillus tubingensis (strain CBS 134.48) TaxID=767770 RepID=A0A1L9MWZ0_ASPTC|nr:hypothetical protein ASPTUDRAFT_833236 [Aspergillus tubingensis CBS 134.48]
MYLPTLTRTTPYKKQAVATRGRDLRTYFLSKESDHSWHDFDLDESWGYDGQGFECADSFLLPSFHSSHLISHFIMI